MVIANTTKKIPSITNARGWIRVAFGNNRNLSCSYGGEKASGAIPEKVFALWSNCIQHKEAALARIGLTKDATIGEIAIAFVARIDTIWPEWDVAPKVPAVGDSVSLNFGKRKGVDRGIVEKVRGTMVTARFQREGVVSVAADLLDP